MCDSNSEGILIKVILENNFVIGSTYNECNKITWVSIDKRTLNQIDHILISSIWSKALLNVIINTMQILELIYTY